MGKPFFVYMLRCADGSYYVGQTDELDVRVAQHQAGEKCAYTTKRRPLELVWSDTFMTRQQAKEVEIRIKGWSRAKKEALIRREYEALVLLARKQDWDGFRERRGKADTECAGSISEETTASPECAGE